ncbi:hypothetical protein T439DRAFT_47541 [Meredithblackwellia eburnea MCA 4105]
MSRRRQEASPSGSVPGSPDSAVFASGAAGGEEGAEGAPTGRGPGTGYKIILSEDNQRDSPHVIMLDPGFGDGDTSRFPAEDDDIKHLPADHSKSVLWRKTAAEWMAKDLGLWDDVEKHWILDHLPEGYGLFEQITHPKADNPKQRLEGARRDRFIFGHAGRKLRSALSLGKHISWIIHGSVDQCTCDGCKSTSKAARVPRGTREQPGSGGRRRGRGRLGSEDGFYDHEEVEDSFFSEREDGIDFDEDSENGPSPRKKAKGSNGTPKIKAPPIPPLPLPPKHEFLVMTATKKDNNKETPSDAQREDDLAHPNFARVGELVWSEVDVPLPSNGCTIQHWPGIVRRREIVKKENAPDEADYVLQLFALSPGVQVSVNNFGVFPWLQHKELLFSDYIMDQDCSTYEELDINKWEFDGLTSEVIAPLFSVAVQMGKRLSSMQHRSIPTVEVGVHLAPSPTARANAPTPGNAPYKLSQMAPTPASARYLTHSHIYFGPELLYPGDCVRLVPNVELPFYAKNQVSLPVKGSLPTSLIMKVTKFLRGGDKSPLLARGRLFELDELNPDGTPAGKDELDSVKKAKYEEFVKEMPPPFPGCQWRCIASSVDVMFTDVAGRYYPCRYSKEKMDDIAKEDDPMDTKTQLVRRGILLGGVTVRDWTPSIRAFNSFSSVMTHYSVVENTACDDVQGWADERLADKKRKVKDDIKPQEASRLKAKAAKSTTSGKGKGK